MAPNSGEAGSTAGPSRFTITSSALWGMTQGGRTGLPPLLEGISYHLPCWLLDYDPLEKPLFPAPSISGQLVTSSVTAIYTLHSCSTNEPPDHSERDKPVKNLVALRPITDALKQPQRTALDRKLGGGGAI